MSTFKAKNHKPTFKMVSFMKESAWKTTKPTCQFVAGQE